MTLRQDWAALRDLPDLESLVAAEREAGRRLLRDGTIVRIWRVPGQRANVGVWQAADATALHAVLERLPLRRWLDADVVALATHELEAT
ncbi:MAG TPA: muconolactone Delta-isomerase family protein [Jatrophihabitans sp.]|nr:muconolactone Delta-isomerase family protein [Jatrophihabitans sp.]